MSMFGTLGQDLKNAIGRGVLGDGYQPQNNLGQNLINGATRDLFGVNLLGQSQAGQTPSLQQDLHGFLFGQPSTIGVAADPTIVGGAGLTPYMASSLDALKSLPASYALGYAPIGDGGATQSQGLNLGYGPPDVMPSMPTAMDPAAPDTGNTAQDAADTVAGRQGDNALSGGGGSDPIFAAAAPATVSPAVVQGARSQPARTPLTGRPGTAAMVAGALNTLASGPNTTAPVQSGYFNGSLTRGRGQDVNAQGGMHIHTPLGDVGGSVNAHGVIQTTPGQGVSISGITGGGGGLTLPNGVRIYNTPGGELDVDLSTPLKLGPLTIASKGAHYIGAPDPPPPKTKR